MPEWMNFDQTYSQSDIDVKESSINAAHASNNHEDI